MYLTRKEPQIRSILTHKLENSQKRIRLFARIKNVPSLSAKRRSRISPKKQTEKEELSNLVLIRNHSTIYLTLIKIQHKLNALTLNGRISSFCYLLTLLLALLLLLSMFYDGCRM